MGVSSGTLLEHAGNLSLRL
jgi:hypothetical protein